MKRFIFSIAFLFFSVAFFALPPSKREFRGAWVQVIGQNQYAGMTPQQMRRYFATMLDSLETLNINALIFQVRPSADAFYPSQLEPWSRYLTGVQGKAPDDGFDPLAFLVAEAHKRNMEFHAWLNPYRVTASESETLTKTHIYYRYPERFVKYGKQIFFNPGLPENRQFICDVVRDIVSRYDIDAIHLDDYFYPYPIAGEKFDDAASFRKYAPIQGFEKSPIEFWRRNNVNLLIEQIKNTIILTKPWVRFGVSPFGIYRNKTSTVDGSGSNTGGLQNYDDLYADILLWMQKGWIDYCVPQLYWQIGHPKADYETLVRWWGQNTYGCHTYIGQDAANAVQTQDLQNSCANQLPAKMQLERETQPLEGNCWWSAYTLLNNTGGIADSLRNNYQRYQALIPAFTNLHNKRPKDVKSLKVGPFESGYLLYWKRNGDPANPEKAQYYVIYCFRENEKTNLDNPARIVAITRNTTFYIHPVLGPGKYKFVVTSVDRFHNESKKGKTKKIKMNF